MHCKFGSWFRVASLVILLPLDILGLKRTGYLECPRVRGFIASLNIVQLLLSIQSFFYLRSVTGTMCAESMATEQVSPCLNLTHNSGTIGLGVERWQRKHEGSKQSDASLCKCSRLVVLSKCCR